MGRYVLLLLFITTIGCKEEIPPKLLDAGISLELAELRIQQLSEVRYQLLFEIPKSKSEAINAELQLIVSVDKSIQPNLIIDFNAPLENLLQVTTADGNTVEHEFKNEHIVIDADAIRDGQNEFHIKFIAGETGLNRFDDYLYTLFVPDRASTVFPCFDQPDLKAKYALELTIPEEWVAVSSGPKLDEMSQGDAKHITFETSDLISTYLFSFVAGKFESVTDSSGTIPMTMYHRESDSAKVQRNVADIFSLHENALSWLERYTAIDFPFKKFDFVVIPSFQYGGMEHVGAIQYRASSLFLDESATTNQLLGRANLIAHETAHMWFGNLVTMRWFNDVWMKEVFANFMAAKITNPVFPEIDHDLRFLLSHYPRAYAVDRTAGTHPIRQELENLKQAGSLYGSIIYQKAPIVMRMLEKLVGQNGFRTGIREYLESHAHAAADWNDLIKILDEKSEANLMQWSQVWVEEAGRPVIDAKYIETLDTYELLLLQIDPKSQNRQWPQSVMAGVDFTDGLVNRRLDFKDRSSISFKIKKNDEFYPKSVVLNTDGESYGVFDLGEDLSFTTHPFGYGMLNIDRNENPVTRGAVYLQLYEFLLYKRVFAPVYPMALERYIFKEPNSLNSELLLDQLETVFWRWMTAEQRERFGHRYEVMLKLLMNQTEDVTMKNTYFKTFVSIVTTEEGVAELLNIWSTESPPDGITLAEPDYSNIAMELALRLPDESADILSTQLDRVINKDRQDRFKFLMPALSAEKAVRDQVFESFMDPINRSSESWVTAAVRYLHHPLHNERSIEYLKASLEELQEIQLSGDIFFPLAWLNSTFWGYQSQEAVDIVHRFLEEHPDFNYRLRNKILQSTDLMERVAEMRRNAGLAEVNPVISTP